MHEGLSDWIPPGVPISTAVAMKPLFSLVGLCMKGSNFGGPRGDCLSLLTLTVVKSLSRCMETFHTYVNGDPDRACPLRRRRSLSMTPQTSLHPRRMTRVFPDLVPLPKKLFSTQMTTAWARARNMVVPPGPVPDQVPLVIVRRRHAVTLLTYLLHPNLSLDKNRELVRAIAREWKERHVLTNIA